jgi:acyl-CoA thioesterase
VAVSVTAMEAETGVDCRWVTVQFVGTAMLGARIDCHTEVLATGKRVRQCRVTGTVDGQVVFSGVGATAAAKPGGYAGQFETMPVVPPPEECPKFNFMGRLPAEVTAKATTGFQRITEFRTARNPDDGRVALWIRVIDHEATPALLGYIADFVPMSVARAGGRVGAGTSLDNTMRFGPRITPEWVLVDLDPHLAADGYGHGTVHLWSPDGELLATGSQTASMLFFD